jgi:hypothetical protein
MEPGLLVQHVLVGLAVVASAGYVVVTRFPAPVRRVRARLALILVRSRRPAVAGLGRRIAPAPSAARCGGCDGCDD